MTLPLGAIPCVERSTRPRTSMAVIASYRMPDERGAAFRWCRDAAALDGRRRSGARRLPRRRPRDRALARPDPPAVHARRRARLHRRDRRAGVRRDRRAGRPAARLYRPALERRPRRRRGRLLAPRRCTRARGRDPGARARDEGRIRRGRRAQPAARGGRQRRVAPRRREGGVQAGGGTTLGALEPAAAAAAGLGDVLAAAGRRVVDSCRTTIATHASTSSAPTPIDQVSDSCRTIAPRAIATIGLTYA